jgi:hypothetical protein
VGLKAAELCARDRGKVTSLDLPLWRSDRLSEAGRLELKGDK